MGLSMSKIFKNILSLYLTLIDKCFHKDILEGDASELLKSRIVVIWMISALPLLIIQSLIKTQGYTVDVAPHLLSVGVYTFETFLIIWMYKVLAAKLAPRIIFVAVMYIFSAYHCSQFGWFNSPHLNYFAFYPFASVFLTNMLSSVVLNLSIIILFTTMFFNLEEKVPTSTLSDLIFRITFSSILAVTYEVNRKKSEIRIKKQVEELNELISIKEKMELTAKLAHQINNPLCIISLCNQKLESEIDDSNTKAHERIKRMKDSIDRITIVGSSLREMFHSTKDELESKV